MKDIVCFPQLDISLQLYKKNNCSNNICMYFPFIYCPTFLDVLLNVYHIYDISSVQNVHLFVISDKSSEKKLQ